MAGGFNANTRQIFRTLPDIPFAANSANYQTLPQTGLYARLWLQFRGSLVVAGGSAGTRATYIPSPMGLVNSIQLRTSEGIDLCNVSPWGLHIHNLTERTATDYSQDPTNSFSFVSPYTRYWNDLPAGAGAVAGPGTYPFRWSTKLPVAWGDANINGLALGQNDVRFDLTINWADYPQMLVPGFVGVGYTFTGLVCRPILEFFQIPTDQQDWPNLAFARALIEERKPIVGNGDQVWQPPLGNIFNRVILEHVYTAGGALQPIPPALITRFRLNYAQIVNPIDCDADVQVFIQRHRYGQDLPTGCYAFEGADGLGLPELPNGRDQLDTNALTDLSITTQYDPTLVPGATAFTRVLKDQFLRQV